MDYFQPTYWAKPTTYVEDDLDLDREISHNRPSRIQPCATAHFHCTGSPPCLTPPNLKSSLPALSPPFPFVSSIFSASFPTSVTDFSFPQWTPVRSYDHPIHESASSYISPVLRARPAVTLPEFSLFDQAPCSAMAAHISTGSTLLSPCKLETSSKTLSDFAFNYKCSYSTPPQRITRSQTNALTPLTPLTPSPTKNLGRQSNKRFIINDSDCDSPTAKRAKVNPSLPAYSTRTLPCPPFVVSQDYPLFYRRFPASSYFQDVFIFSNPGGEYNPPRSALDLYSPRFVKGRGASKVGLCPICVERRERGGEGKKVWLPMKVSAFNYHMQYYHGISAATGRPLSPPTNFRLVGRPNHKKGERSSIQEAKCHKCNKWIVVQTIKDIPVKVPELFWWKHAVGCHNGSALPGEKDYFENDAVYRVLVDADTGHAV